MRPAIRFLAGLPAGLLALNAPLVRAAGPSVCATCVKANMQQLAGEAFHGRGCGTSDEHAAAAFIADRLKSAGVAPGLGRGGYLQSVRLETPTFAATPSVRLKRGETELRLTLGEEMTARDLPAALNAATIRLDPETAVAAAVGGKAVIYGGPFNPDVIGKLIDHGAAVVLVAAPEIYLQHWGELTRNAPGRPIVVGAAPPPGARGAVVLVKPDQMPAVIDLAGGEIQIDAPAGPAVVRTTYNVVGMLHGKAADADHHSVLLSAHYDHLGVRNGATFPGANDDASGTAAVLEFARIFGGRPKHGRTAYFALMGCEEVGLLGAQYFFSHPPMGLTDLVANLEFEMIGVDDPNRSGSLMLTGWERSNLGPALVAHRARVQPDGYPLEHFFQRSDNYQLALRGVVAQTVSAWPKPPTYHQPSDDLAHVDIDFMSRVIGSLIAPLDWLLDSDFQPEWLPGQKP